LTKQLKKQISLTPSTIEHIAELAKNGVDSEDIYNIISSEERIDKKQLANHSDVKRLEEYGKSVGIATVASALFEAACNGSVQAQMFYLRAKGKWRDGVTQEQHTGFSHEEWLQEIDYKARKKIKDVGTQEIE